MDLTVLPLFFVNTFILCYLRFDTIFIFFCQYEFIYLIVNLNKTTTK